MGGRAIALASPQPLSKGEGLKMKFRASTLSLRHR